MNYAQSHTLTVVAAPGADESEGQTFGRYKLVEKLGEGGFGAVWLAEQKEPVRRKVALKIIKLGMDTKAVVARFEAERQALAMMDHPNIAKVLDAGATESGRPYFVMELVRGIRITEYSDGNHLSTQERLDLFIKVCQAIQHAHQKGIIHRDIKPSNILVTLHDGAPVPKVIGARSTPRNCGRGAFLLAMNSMTFSTDSTRLLVGGSGKEALKFYDTTTLHELLTLEAD